MITQKNIKARPRHKQNGVGLIEVLVALVVVSFGVLGMASLQLTGMKHSSGSFNRSKALLYAQSMATRIRLNPVAVNSDAYNEFDSDAINCAVLPAPYCQARKDVNTTQSCTPAELATFDLYTVTCGEAGTNGGADKGVQGTLPNGNLTVGCVVQPCTADSAYEVMVTWSEGRPKTNSDELVTRRVQVRLRP